MGCDGGTIPKRDEIVRSKKKKETIGKEDERSAKWNHCSMSHENLRRPLVACETGRIFNKESILNFLIQRKQAPESVDGAYSYIRNLRDVRELRMTPNPEFKDGVEKHGQSQKAAQFICPIAGLEMNGCHRFVFLWSCGCVYSERGLREVKDGMCGGCNQKYAEEDIVQLNSLDEEEVNKSKERMKERRAKNDAVKEKKKKRQRVEEEPDKGTFSSAPTEGQEPPSKVSKVEEGNLSFPAAPKVTSAKFAKTSTGGKPSTDGRPKGESNVSAKPKSIQDDPNASETYKSIFTTHVSAKRQTKAHWVTSNPHYY